ncbi:Na(+)/H(+) antiporter NhaA [Solemya pervernicosa gill symbiont]|uniref:Na(+)/H(+) antiporter NhaA n=2 Tax=Gammaproteobacteria incertae sedis TaxID=118884 RepID=A0A1T2L2H7_9GAMM|nr:Na+/H+ antiporter NhaA [Candidatus Reidiella endopervernicosa]OOZ39295.1 Na(+)/H(+) antiporter NhaA [Solemya pervernicosa gill symbiont]QKQ25525.1 Na+/H+ antiporter NhaA [Candidatus Reidiella endopervernicosa]
MMSSMREFFKLESSSGIILVVAAILAMIMANSPLAIYYNMLIEMPVEVRVGPLELAKPLLLWINDGLMAVFFFLVGLELKRELLEGELKQIGNVVLPGLAAVGGMVVPALFYLLFNQDNTTAMQGWAIPTATDIAFALGVLSLLGKRVPISLKIFLVSLAIFDDMGAIIIIAIFYTADISLLSMMIAASCLVGLFILNRRGTSEMTPYILLGTIMWVAVLKSGVHATLAGVALALFIPMKSRHNPGQSLLKQMEHDLHGAVAFFILPLFAFANAGISLEGIGLSQLLHPVPLGIATGLFFGKQIGVFLFCWLGIKLGLARLPSDISWGMLYGVSLITGIGFTMSLFVGSLAFEETGINMLFDERLGIIIGSLLSAVCGYFVLRHTLPK